MATKRWVGGAGKVRQRSTITMALVWAASDTVTVKIGGSSLICTVGAQVATNDIAGLVSAAINAADATTGLLGNETRNAGGQELAEFVEVSATVSGAIVTVEGLAGIPFTLTSSQVTAGSGTATAATGQAATGPNHFDNADNWDTGTLPASGDVIEFTRGSVNCEYGLGFCVTNTVDADWTFTTDYTGTVGLPEYHALTSVSGAYREYRTRYIALYDILSAKDLRITSGTSGGTGGILQFDGSSFDCNDIVIDDPGTVVTQPSVRLYGGKSDTFYIGQGWVAIDPLDSPVGTGHELSALIVGPLLTSTATVPIVTVGPATTFNGAIAGTFNSGATEIQAILDQGANEMAVTVRGGTVESKRAQAHAAVTVKGGTYKWSGSGAAAGAIQVWTSGILDLRGSGESQTYAGGVTMFGGSFLYKGGHTLTPTLSGCNDDQVTIVE